MTWTQISRHAQRTSRAPRRGARHLPVDRRRRARRAPRRRALPAGGGARQPRRRARCRRSASSASTATTARGEVRLEFGRVRDGRGVVSASGAGVDSDIVFALSHHPPEGGFCRHCGSELAVDVVAVITPPDGGVIGMPPAAALNAAPDGGRHAGAVFRWRPRLRGPVRSHRTAGVQRPAPPGRAARVRAGPPPTVARARCLGAQYAAVFGRRRGGRYRRSCSRATRTLLRGRQRSLLYACNGCGLAGFGADLDARHHPELDPAPAAGHRGAPGRARRLGRCSTSPTPTTRRCGRCTSRESLAHERLDRGGRDRRRQRP